MRHNSLFIFIILTVFLVACKKDKPELSSENEVPGQPAEQAFYKDLKIDSIQQLSIVVSFQLNKTAKIIGLLTTLDSASLVNREQDYMKREMTFRNDRYYTKIEWPYNLPPTDDVFWFRLYMIDEMGTKTYSPVFRQKIATFQIKNKYVVNGKGAYNKHPKDFYINFEGGVIGTYDNSLIVDAVTNDVNLENYRATLNEIPISISRIDPLAHPPTHKHILFDVPDDFPLGQANFKFYYLDKMVYSTELTIVNGGLLSSIKHPVAKTNSGCFFEYNGKLFTYTYYSWERGAEFYSWTPETNVWQKLPVPKEMSNLTYNFVSPAKVINGIVYFQPQINTYGGGFDGTPPNYEELLITYNPNTGESKTTKLFHTTNKAEARSLNVVDYFVYGDRLYCITSELINGQSTSSAHRIRVYNPADNSWTHFMDLPYSGVWGWTAIVNVNQVFLLNAKSGKQESASTEFLNEFYLLNMSSKSLTKKSWISDREVGVYKPYLTSYNNKIYVYGGYYSTGYSSLYSSLFAVYDPEKDKWSPVSGYSYFTGWVSQIYGFMFPIGNKLYLGLGIDRVSNGNIHASKSNYSIFQVAIK